MLNKNIIEGLDVVLVALRTPVLAIMAAKMPTTCTAMGVYFDCNLVAKYILGTKNEYTYVLI